MTIVAVLVVSLIIAAMYVKILMGTMNNVVSPGQANAYVVENSFRVHSKKDRFICSNVTKTPKPQSNNGAGGPGRGPGGPGRGPGGGGRGGRR
ncbi:MAG: hypothetical protein R3Y40_07425 [Eubacteriales bacterium]